jgi:hypothetical protein
LEKLEGDSRLMGFFGLEEKNLITVRHGQAWLPIP